MRYGLRSWLGAAIASTLVVSLAVPRAARSGEPPVPTGLTATGALTLLSYNVEGLPWPLTHGRGAAARQIAERLRALREQGAAPQVIALQEAFGDAQKGIGSSAGYRYAAFGPSATTMSPLAATAEERAFDAGAGVLHGETEGAWEDSGLAIFSDYPILWSRRMPFPRYACAGFDCLANKGILAVALRVPGHTAPLLVVDTHLNSRTASGVDDRRSFAAYRRQVDLLSVVVRRLERSGSPVLLAGDFNVGDDAVRGRYLSRALDGFDRMEVGAAEMTCGAACRAVAPRPSVARSKTIIFHSASSRSVDEGREFGALPQGRRLSDHIGITQEFDLTA